MSRILLRNVHAEIARTRPIALTIFAALAVTNFGLGQAAPQPPAKNAATDDELIELSPFVTTASTDKGYVATSSLAGSRVNTNLKDIAAQIDVMTPEFLNDIAAISLDEAVSFTTNNGSNAEQNVGPNDGTTSTRAGGRARGFDAITQSSDFYATNLPSDFYNVERLTIANGPQSILFGLGNAGGALDVSTKRALMRDRGEVALRADEWGSMRSMIDLNQQLVPKKLAVRVVGLKNNGRGYVEDSYNRQQRLFGTVTWQATPSTRVHVSVENVSQRASMATNYVAQDYLSPWIAAGSPLYDNSTGNGSVTASAFPLLGKNSNALRVLTYGAGPSSVLIWNGSALTKGPHQLAGAIDTRDYGLADSSIYPTSRDVRVGGRLNRLHGKLLRGAIEQKVTDDLYLELGFNYESTSELLGGPFDNAESINIFADPNRYLPGGTATARQTALNPNAGKMYIESYPAGTEARRMTKEARLTASYQFDFARHASGFARYFGRHRIAALTSWRVDEDRTQDSRAMILGNPSFATGDLLNNSRLLRARYYLDPGGGYYTARAMPGAGEGNDAGWFGPWTVADSARGEVFQATMFDDPAGRQTATGGSRKDIGTYMGAIQSYFFKDHLNLFAGRRVDKFKNYLVAPWALVRQDRVAPGDKQGLYYPLSQVTFDNNAALDDSGTTYSYGAVYHVVRWLSVFASRSDNTALPQPFLDPNNQPLRGIYSDGYDYGFRVATPSDSVSLRVNFYREHQHNLIGDSQTVRTDANTVEQRLRGVDKPAGIADVPADGYDPVTRGAGAYRSVEDKIGRGVDMTLVANITRNWDLRVAVGRQQTHVFNKSADFTAWVEHRLPVWQQFGGLGWDKVTISTTDSRTVHQYYDQEIAAEILRAKLRNDLPRFRQREWRASVFTNYRVSEGWLRGLNAGGGMRWLGRPNNGFVQMIYPDGNTGDDVTKQLYGYSQTVFDLLVGYGRKVSWFGPRPLGWRLQLNVRNLFDHHGIEPLRSSYTGGTLDWGRVEGRQAILSSSITF